MTPEDPVFAEIRLARVAAQQPPAWRIRPLSRGARLCLFALWTFVALVGAAAVLDGLGVLE
jgi:hypothetical protein